MDYSAINADDNPHDSPWASSPQRSRNGLDPQLAGNEPPSPTPGLSRASIDSAGGFEDQDNMPSRPNQVNTVVENGHAQSSVSEAAPQSQIKPGPNPTTDEQQQAQDPNAPQTAQNSQQTPRVQQKSTQRYHGQRPKSRQELPVYKLQPKIAGLERPSRKDLIVRFDIYVSMAYPFNVSDN